MHIKCCRVPPIPLTCPEWPILALNWSPKSPWFKNFNWGNLHRLAFHKHTFTAVTEDSLCTKSREEQAQKHFNFQRMQSEVAVSIFKTHSAHLADCTARVRFVFSQPLHRLHKWSCKMFERLGRSTGPCRCCTFEHYMNH